MDKRILQIVLAFSLLSVLISAYKATMLHLRLNDFENHLTWIFYVSTILTLSMGVLLVKSEESITWINALKRKNAMGLYDDSVSGGFFSFHKMFSTVLIKIVYFIGFVALSLGGLVALFQGDEVAMLGLIALTIGNLLWRLFCEAWIILFSIHDLLGSIDKRVEKLLTQKTPRETPKI
ncbi:MAG: DUF4282 domain-containing protein [candidate division KSB1 bacterium]|nr:DUF4282 domain-containing protein [candidate division KSB1 bacterium]